MTAHLVRRLWARAQHYIEIEQIAAARVALESILKHEPSHTAARLLLASTILGEGRVREAASHMLRAARLVPGDATAACAAASCLKRLGENLAAHELIRHLRIDGTVSGETLLEIAHVLQALGDHPASLALMNRARLAGYDSPDFRYFRSLQLQFNGHLDEAERELEACLRLGPTHGRALLALARMRTQTPRSNHLEHIRAGLGRVQQGSEHHAALEFALYKELEDLGDAEAACAALTRGNAIMFGRLQHDPQQEDGVVDALVASFRPGCMGPARDDPMQSMPIFIIGMPRSGTTLLDRILGNHSMVVSAGERDDFPKQLRWTADLDGAAILDLPLLERLDRLDYALLGRRYLLQTRWRAQGKRFYVDKLPVNYMLAGCIATALPAAPILHMVRSPMDVCFSNYKAFFGDGFAYSYELNAVAAQYRRYRRLMAHWHRAMPGRIMDVSYDALVGDPENTIRAVLAHCNLPYEAGCEDLGRNASAVATLSSPQVRGRIHRRARGEWKRYSRQLQPLRTALQSDK